MTTPSKTCVRRRVPSMTWKWTRTRSPAWNWGTRRSCARSRDSMTLLMGSAQRNARAGLPRRAVHGSEQFRRFSRLRALAGLRPALAASGAAPRADLGVVAGEQDVRHLPAPILGRARVVRVLRVAAERLGERLLGRRLRVAEGARQLAQHGIG